MPKQPAHNKPAPWTDRFRSPDAETLLAELQPEHVGWFTSIREELMSAAACSESLEWAGLPWRWSFHLRSDEVKAAEPHPFAVLVPNPEGPSVAMPLPLTMVAALPMRRLSRYIRDGLAEAKAVGETLFAEWKLGAASHVDDIADLARRKVRFDPADHETSDDTTAEADPDNNA